MAVRGVRGAITADKNSKEDIVSRTKELLVALIEKNGIEMEDVASVIFSATSDLDEEFPAVAARELGWLYTPLFCTREIPVKGSMARCIRVLMHVNSDKRQDEMIQIYMYDAKKLRPDLDSSETNRYYIS